MMRVRDLTCLIAGLVFSTAASAASQYPDKPIRWVVPSSPGDGSDVTARLIAQKVSVELGQSIVIENRPGAGGILGSQFVAQSAPDGYTMVVGNAGSHEINAAIYHNLHYRVVEDFAPVALFCTAPNVMVVSPEVKAKDVPAFVALAKSEPGKLNYASGGVGSSAHMSAELFKSITGTDMRHIPFKGSTPAISALVANQVQVMIGNLPPWMELIKAGKVRALAVTSSERVSALPDVPAMAEYYPGFQTEAWFGLLAPIGTPKAIVDQVNAAVNHALAQNDVKALLGNLSCAPAGTTPAAFSNRIVSNVARWKELAEKNGIKAD
ncbi:MAG TPA: tripartite tricarboxylate transporter substrate binding protein [Bordetella sp.]|nr:tripartite tricarboxylate transporter substrate binding protein [Bordetella sp.]